MKCPHQGDDARLLHWLVCPIQRTLLFSGGPPITAALQWPPHFWIQGKTKRGWWFFRIGLRYDWNAGVYLLAAAFKRRQPEWTRF